MLGFLLKENAKLGDFAANGTFHAVRKASWAAPVVFGPSCLEEGGWAPGSPGLAKIPVQPLGCRLLAVLLLGSLSGK